MLALRKNQQEWSGVIESALQAVRSSSFEINEFIPWPRSLKESGRKHNSTAHNTIEMSPDQENHRPAKMGMLWRKLVIHNLFTHGRDFWC